MIGSQLPFVVKIFISHLSQVKVQLKKGTFLYD